MPLYPTNAVEQNANPKITIRTIATALESHPSAVLRA